MSYIKIFIFYLEFRDSGCEILIMTMTQKQMPMLSVVLLIICSLASFNKMYGDAIDVTHFCYDVANEPTKMRLVVNILVKTSDTFSIVYAFDASATDTTKSTDRITACSKDDTGISDTVPITYDIIVTTTDTSHDCGIQLTTEGSDTIVNFLFRIYTMGEHLNYPGDISYKARCNMNDLTGTKLDTLMVETTGRGNEIKLQRQADGAFLRLIDEDNKAVSVARVGDKVRLSAEYYPNLQKGPDNCGLDFYVGFLGIDPLSGESASELSVIISPRYKLDTDIIVTTKDGESKYSLVQGNSVKLVLPSEFMGCSDGGVAEIEDKGVRIQSLSEVREICVVVCSKETETGDCYDALPVDVLGTDYIAASMSVADEPSEIMIISHADGNQITVDIPDGYAHTIELSGQTTSSAGGSITFQLNQMQAFHLAQTSSTAGMSNVNGYHISSTTPVSVISGNRNYAANHAMIQLPPTTKADTNYVLIPADVHSDGRLTTYIIQPVESGDTEVIRYLTASTSETYTITYGEYLSLDIGVPCEVTAEKQILVTLVVNGPVSGKFGSSMAWVPPVNRWAPVYTLSHPEYTVTSMTVFKSQEDMAAYKAAYEDEAPFPLTPISEAVEGPSGYIFGKATSLSPGKFTFFLDGVVSTFYMAGFLADASDDKWGSALNGIGLRLSDFESCVEFGRRGDLLDNDCDGEIDEEILDNMDNDGDGNIDEDLRVSVVENSGAVAIAPKNCMVSPDPTFPDNNIDRLTDANGCAVSGVFTMNAEFEPYISDNTGSGTQPKILRSGLFNIAQYVDYPMLYFKCDIAKYCISTADETCTTICNTEVTRKRRQVNSENSVDNITTSTWVFPYDVSPSKPSIKETVQGTSSFASCLDNTYVQISYILLLILVLVSFFTALCFCCLFRRNSRREKEIDKKIYKQRTKQMF